MALSRVERRAYLPMLILLPSMMAFTKVATRISENTTVNIIVFLSFKLLNVILLLSSAKLRCLRTQCKF